jgi:hypothetical protein
MEIVYQDEELRIEKTPAKQEWSSWDCKSYTINAIYKLYKNGSDFCLCEVDEEKVRFSKKLIRRMLEEGRAYLSQEIMAKEGQVVLLEQEIETMEKLRNHINRIKKREDN